MNREEAIKELEEALKNLSIANLSVDTVCTALDALHKVEGYERYTNDLTIENKMLAIALKTSEAAIEALKNKLLENEIQQNKFKWRDVSVELPEPLEYDWVLVCDEIGNKPRLAEYSRITKKWHTDSYEDGYDFEEWFSVNYWRPIE